MRSEKSVCSKAMQVTDIPVKVIKGKNPFISMNILVKENFQTFRN